MKMRTLAASLTTMKKGTISPNDSNGSLDRERSYGYARDD